MDPRLCGGDGPKFKCCFFMSEFDLIAKYFTRTSSRGDVLLGVGDDAAVLQVPANRRLVAAVDTIVEGVHFPVGTDAAAIGHRVLAVNLSDMAAMGAEPAWITLSLSLPSGDAHWLEGFSSGLYALADRFHVALVGGDTVRGPLSMTIQVMGLVEVDCWLTRSGAKPGDAIFVSGIPGEAAAGLAVLQRSLSNSSASEQLVQRFLWPEPRVSLGRVIRTLASAAIDVSDGVIADLNHICTLSGCGAQIELESLPQSPAMQALFDVNECERLSLSGGDDYELLFTVANERMGEVTAALAAGVRCTQIGRMVEGSGVTCHRAGQPVTVIARGYDHFG
jgi:thiamine-monophosphate kinase